MVSIWLKSILNLILNLGVAGGIVEQEAAIELSNIAIWNPKKKKADRISFLIENDKKVRVYSSDKLEIKS